MIHLIYLPAFSDISFKAHLSQVMQTLNKVCELDNYCNLLLSSFFYSVKLDLISHSEVDTKHALAFESWREVYEEIGLFEIPSVFKTAKWIIDKFIALSKLILFALPMIAILTNVFIGICLLIVFIACLFILLPESIFKKLLRTMSVVFTMIESNFIRDGSKTSNPR